ncbi:MAG: single-stranded DNA-binding protein [Bacteroidia bacterium]
MSALNKVLLIGNLGKEPEIKHLEAGHCKATFQLATTEHYKNREGQRQEQTEWHTIIAWRGLADSIEKSQLKKGTLVYVEGKMRNRMYDDRDGVKRSVTEIVADVVSILKRPLNGEHNNGNSDHKTLSNIEAPGPAGDLPF